MVVDDLQTLCTKELREAAAAAAAARGAGDGDAPPPPVDDPRLVDAFLSSLAAKDKPALQVESARALVDIFERLTVEQQREVRDQLVPSLLKQPPQRGDDGDKNDNDNKNDEPPTPMIGDWLREMICSEDRRNLILGPVVQGIRTHGDPDLQLESMGYLRAILQIEPAPPVQKVVVTGIVPDIVGLLLRNDNTELQRAATTTLDQLLKVGRNEYGADAVARKEYVADAVVSAGAITALVRLLQESTNANVKEGAASVVRGIAIGNPCHRELFRQNGCMRRLVDLTISNADSSGTRRAAVAALVSVLDPWERPPMEEVQQALPALAKAIEGDDEETLHLACGCLYVLTRKFIYMELVIASGVCPRLVELLCHPSPKVLEPVIDTIGDIFWVGSHEQAWAILRHDPLPSLHRLMANPGNYPLACWTICRLVNGKCSNGLQQVIEAGIAPSVIELLGNSDSYTRSAATWTIYHSVNRGTAQQTQFLVGAGCIPSLCRVLYMEEEDRIIIEPALSALEAILVHGESMARNDAPSRGDDGSAATTANPMAALMLSADAGVLTRIREIQQQHSEDYIRENAAKLLHEYFPDEEYDDMDAAYAEIDELSIDGDSV